jgi:hypothetical protein
MAVEPGEPATDHLESVRAELRRLGYLNRGFERFLLQDAMRPRRPGRTLFLLTAKVGLLAGLALSIALAFLLAAANGGLASLPRDLPVLALHLFPPIALLTGAAFLVLCGLVVLVLRLYHVRHIETLALAAAVAAGAGGLALALWRGRELVAGASPWQLAAVAVAAPAVIYLVVKLAYHGLLALAIRLTDAPPPRRLFSRRWLGFAILSVAFLLTLPAVLSARRADPAPPAALPTAPGERVLLVGIDGVLPEEVDYLLRAGDLPAFARLARQGGALLSYARRPEPPASFWTSVATGLPTPDHGVTALDSFLPWGAATPLARSGPLRAYWSGVEVPLGLAEHRPVLANRRRAFTVWELAARGGAPVAAIDWWSTFPADPLPGLVVAHGAYQLLAERTPGAVAPGAAAPELVRLASQVAARPEDARMAAALPAAAAGSLLARALLPDRFYREVLARQLAPASGLAAGSAAGSAVRSAAANPPRAAALYLPGLDIAAAGWRGGDIAFADLLRGELQATDGLLARSSGEGFGTIALVLDPGRRRSGGEGRIILWRSGWPPGGCGAGPETPAAGAAAAMAGIAPEAVAAALLRALGLPQSAELPPPPALGAACSWPAPPAAVAGYGRPRREPPVAREGGEYLDNLRSLGYL